MREVIPAAMHTVGDSRMKGEAVRDVADGPPHKLQSLEGEPRPLLLMLQCSGPFLCQCLKQPRTLHIETLLASPFTSLTLYI